MGGEAYAPSGLVSGTRIWTLLILSFSRIDGQSADKGRNLDQETGAGGLEWVLMPKA